MPRTSADPLQEPDTKRLDVAVIVVSYRTAPLVIDGLRSIANDSDVDGLSIRAIVIDNHSGDFPIIAEAIRINKWDSWVTLIESPINGGFAYGNNLGIEKAYAVRPPDYVYLLNPDAQVRRGAIASLVRFLEATPGAGIAGSSFENLDGSSWPMAFRFPSLLSELTQGLELKLATRLLRRWTVAMEMSLDATQPVDWICGASMMIRPAVFAAIGGLDENYFLYFEETDFCFRARAAGYTTWYVPQSRVMHVAGQSTQVTGFKSVLTRNPSYWFESRRRYFAATFGIRRAIAIDLLGVIAYSLGTMKRILLFRPRVPHFVRDLLGHSIIWPRNRFCPPPRYNSPWKS